MKYRNSTKKKLLSLKYLCDQVNDMSREHAINIIKNNERSCGETFLSIKLNIDFDYLDKKHCAEVDIHIMNAIFDDFNRNINIKHHQSLSSPSSFEIFNSGSVDYIEFDEVINLIRSAHKAGGMHNLLFEKKKVTIVVPDFFEFKGKVA